MPKAPRESDRENATGRANVEDTPELIACQSFRLQGQVSGPAAPPDT